MLYSCLLASASCPGGENPYNVRFPRTDDVQVDLWVSRFLDKCSQEKRQHFQLLNLIAAEADRDGGAPGAAQDDADDSAQEDADDPGQDDGDDHDEGDGAAGGDGVLSAAEAETLTAVRHAGAGHDRSGNWPVGARSRSRSRS